MMKKIKYLFICCFVIMGLLVGFYMQNVDAYQVAESQEAQSVQVSNDITQTSTVCPLGHTNCHETHTQTCSLGHVNCQMNHHAQTQQQKQSHHGHHSQHRH